MNNNKPVFVAKEDFAKIFQDKIFRRIGIKLDAKPYKNGEVVLSAREESYNDVISTAFKIAEGMYTINEYHIRWVNDNMQECPLRFVNLFTGYLPETRKYNGTDKLCPPDIEEYRMRLENTLQKSIIVRYHEDDNSIDFLVHATPEEFSSLKSSCEQATRNIDHNPFTNTVFPINFAGKLPTVVKEEKTPKTNDFFTSSLFMDALLKPEKLAPAKSTDKSKSGYVLEDIIYGVRKLKTEDTELTATKTVVRGEYVTYEKRYYDYLWLTPGGFGSKTDNQPKEPHIMLDNATFESDIEFESLKEVTLSTHINLVRSVMECNFDDSSVRDSLYRGIPHDDYRGTTKLIEHFVVIANGTKLLHYSMSIDCFEVYALPIGWTPLNGLDCLKEPTTYDKKTFEQSSPNYSEIAEYLGLKPKSHELRPIEKI